MGLFLGVCSSVESEHSLLPLLLWCMSLCVCVCVCVLCLWCELVCMVGVWRCVCVVYVCFVWGGVSVRGREREEGASHPRDERLTETRGEDISTLWM